MSTDKSLSSNGTRASAPSSPITGFDREGKILLCVSGVEPEDRQKARLAELLAEEFDTAALMELASQNRVLPLLAKHLVAAPGISEELRSQIRWYHDDIAIHNLQLTQELVEVSQLFESNGISSLTYKGPSLAALVYESLSLRQFWDLDLLIHKNQVLQAKALLIERGYKPEFELDAKAERRHLRRDCEYNFDHPEKDIHLEIHWEILDAGTRHGFRADFLWDRTMPVRLAGSTVTTLAREELFLVLCIHGGEKHSWNRLRWISDLAFFARIHPELDWDRILHLADRFRRRRTVLLGAYLAAALLQAPLPKAILDAAHSDPLIPAFAALTRARLFRPDTGLPGYREWSHFMDLLQGSPYAPANGRSRGASRWLYYRAVMKPNWEEEHTLPLPPALSFLHYLYRPIRLVSRHRARILDRLR